MSSRRYLPNHCSNNALTELPGARLIKHGDFLIRTMYLYSYFMSIQMCQHQRC